VNCFEFEELIADMLDITDDQRDDDEYVEQELYKKFGIDFEEAFTLTKALLLHVPPIQAGFSGKSYHAFMSKTLPVMLMKLEVES